MIRLRARFHRHPRLAATALLMVVVLGVWAWLDVDRARALARIAQFQTLQRNHTADDVHEMLGPPYHVVTGADVLSKVYWGSDVAVGRNNGQVVRDERYVHSGLRCSYLIVIGYGPDGHVRSKFYYDG